MSELPSLGPEARAAIEGELRAPGADAAARARLRARLSAALPLGPLVAPVHSATAPASVAPAAGTAVPPVGGAGHSLFSVGGRVLQVLARHPAPLVAAGLTLGGFGGAAIQAKVDRSATRRASAHRVEAAAPVVPPLLPVAPAPAATPPASIDHPTHPAPAMRAVTRPAPARPQVAPPAPALAFRPPDADVGLAGETALIERARSALARGWSDSALAALEQHRTRFPQGQFVEEREALQVLALARAGRSDEAIRQAASFRRQFPQSLWLEQVDRAEAWQP